MNDYERETAEYLAHGLTLFQCGLFDVTEPLHALRFCEWTQPSGVVVDMGAGIGAMGRLIQAICPAITRVLNVTNSAAQEKIATLQGSEVVVSDFHSVPAIPDGVADFVMFNESFGYGEPETLMSEAARMLKLGGRLVVKDFSANSRLLDVIEVVGWQYRAFPQHAVLAAAAKAGLLCTTLIHPRTTASRWNAFVDRSRMTEWHGTEDPDNSHVIFIFQKVDRA